MHVIESALTALERSSRDNSMAQQAAWMGLIKVNVMSQIFAGVPLMLICYHSILTRKDPMAIVKSLFWGGRQSDEQLANSSNMTWSFVTTSGRRIAFPGNQSWALGLVVYVGDHQRAWLGSIA